MLHKPSSITRIFKILSWAAFLIILMQSIRMRHHLPAVPLADPDTWGYLNPALSWLSGEGLQQTHGRNWLYPALVSLFLLSGKGFYGIILWQQFFGILSMILLWIALRKWQRFFPSSLFVEVIGSAVLLLAMALIGLNPRFLAFERELRPEGLFQSVVLIQLSCLIGFIYSRWFRPNVTGFWLYGSFTIVLSYISFLLKPSWGFSLVLTILPVMIGCFMTTNDKACKHVYRFSFKKISAPFLVFLTSTILLLTLLFLPGWLGWKRDKASITFLPLTLFSVHADIILQSIKAHPDYHDLETKAFHENLVVNLERALKEARNAPHSFQKLGFDADFIMYRSSIPSQIFTQQQCDEEKMSSFLKKLYFTAWLTKPLSMTTKIARQLTLFIFPYSTTFYGVNSKLAQHYQNSASALPKDLPGEYHEVFSIYSDYLQTLVRAGQGLTSPPKNRMLQKIAAVTAFLAPWIQLVFLLCLALTLLPIKLRSRLYSERLPALTTLAVALATYGNVLTIAVIHSLDIDRYRFSYGAFFIITLAMMTIVGLSTVYFSLFDKPEKV